MRIHLVWAGKTRERHCAALINDYLGRIRRFSPLELTEVREAKGAGTDEQARRIESDRLIEAVSGDDYVVLLDERGEQRTDSRACPRDSGRTDLQGVHTAGGVTLPQVVALSPPPGASRQKEDSRGGQGWTKRNSRPTATVLLKSGTP